MAIKNEGKVPKIRYPGFDDQWEQCKLDDIAEINPKSEIPDEFEYVDLEAVIGTEMISHRTETKETAPSRAQRLGQIGDLFYQTVRPYQKNNYILSKSDRNYVFSTGYAQIRSFLDSNFLLCSVQNDRFVNKVLENCTGTSYPAINTSDLGKLAIGIPMNLDESKKIGAFFQQLDETITLHQRKMDLLKNYKNGMLQKIFPKNGTNIPDVRYPEFTDPWEQRKLSEQVEFYSGLTYKPEDVQKSGTLVLRSSNVKNDSIVSSDNVYVLNQVATSEPVKKGDIIVVVRNGSRDLIGKHAQVKEEMPNTVIGAFMTGIRSKHSSFVNSLLSTSIFKSEVTKNMGSTINQITGYMFANMEFYFPKEHEQDQIGSFFQQIDDTIALHHRKLDLLKEYKKGLLQQMFV